MYKDDFEAYCSDTSATSAKSLTYVCALCGRIYGSPVERAKCEIECHQKIEKAKKHAEEARKRLERAKREKERADDFGNLIEETRLLMKKFVEHERKYGVYHKDVPIPIKEFPADISFVSIWG